MTKPGSFPNAMDNLIESRFGQIISIESLRGVAGSGSSTYKLVCKGGSVVVKSSPNPRERYFYERYAEGLRYNGVHIAAVGFMAIAARNERNLTSNETIEYIVKEIPDFHRLLP